MEIDDNIYSAPTYFPDNNDCRNWVPIGVKTSYVTNVQDKATSSCTIFPLHLCWAFSPWRIQGQTINNTLVANLGKSEKSPGLSYVFFSRLRKFSNLLIDGGLTFDCLTNKILSNKRFKDRVKYKWQVLEVKTRLTKAQYLSRYS